MNTLQRSLAAVIALVTFLVYFRTASYPFINYDDPVYVAENVQVSAGLSWESVRWALTTAYAANWHPLTWISHQLDCQLFGLNPGSMHLMSAGLHAANGVLLFVFLTRATGATGCSACAAAFFALHPLRVESVAWIAERKDVLSGFFWLLTMLAYLHYTRRPSVGRYLAVATAFVAGLLAKPMVVTLPFALLLLDVWPLVRLDSVARLRALVLEKVPLFALAAAAACITFIVQRQGGAVVALESAPLAERMSKALLAVYFYLGKIFWPVDLFVPYWYDVQASPWVLGAGAVGLVAITAVLLRLGKVAPYLPVGWLWFLGTLVPVIGIVQVGAQSAADRYTYLPSIGITVASVWAAAAASRWGVIAPAVFQAGGALAVGLCGVLSLLQAGYWKDSVTLFERTLDLDPPNLIAMDLLAWTYAADPDPRLRNGAKALSLAELTAQITERRDGYSLSTLAAALAESGKYSEAVKTAEEALALPETNAQPQLRDELLKNLDRYRAGKAVRDR